MTTQTEHCTDCHWNETTMWDRDGDGCPLCGAEVATMTKPEALPEEGDQVEVDGVGPTLTVTQATGVESGVPRYRFEGPRGGEYGGQLWRNGAPLQPWALEVWRSDDKSTLLTNTADDADYKGSPNYRPLDDD